MEMGNGRGERGSFFNYFLKLFLVVTYLLNKIYAIINVMYYLFN